MNTPLLSDFVHTPTTEQGNFGRLVLCLQSEIAAHIRVGGCDVATYVYAGPMKTSNLNLQVILY